MKLPYRKHMLPIAVATGLVTLVLACSAEMFSPKRSGSDQATARQVAPELGSSGGQRTYSKEEIHARNRMDWVGRAHNHVVELALVELRKPEVSLSNLCEHLRVVLAKPGTFAPFASRMPAATAEEMRTAVQESAFCSPDFRRIGKDLLSGPRRTTKTASLMGSMATEPSDTAIALYEATVAETEQATDANDLASRLSPIIDAGEELTGLDEDFVLMAVAVAQYTYDFWSGGASQDLIDDIMETEIEPCYAGQAENQTFEADGNTWVCQGLEWREAAYRGPRTASPIFQLASLTTRPTKLVSCSGDGYNYRWGWVGGADVAALGIAGLMSKVTGPNPWYLVGVGAVSVGAGAWEAGRWISCNVM
jgi:hypothetical protein